MDFRFVFSTGGNKKIQSTVFVFYCVYGHFARDAFFAFLLDVFSYLGQQNGFVDVVILLIDACPLCNNMIVLRNVLGFFNLSL